MQLNENDFWRKDRTIVAGFLLLVFIVLLYLNHITPLWTDDYCRYGVENFTEALSEAARSYREWSGRFFVILQTYLVLGTPPFSLYVFDFLNSLIFVALIYVIFLCANGDHPRGLASVVDLLLITVLILALCSRIPQTVFWKTGAINYLWAVTGELFVLWRFLFRDRVSSSSRLRSGLFIFFCFYISTFLENLSIAVIAGLIYLWIDATIKGQPLQKTYKAAAIAHVVGFLILSFARGNFKRADVIFDQRPLTQKVLEISSSFYQTLLSNGWILVLAVSCFLFLIAKKSNEGKAENGSDGSSALAIFFTALAIASMLVLSASPSKFEGRTAFPTEIFLIVAIASLFKRRPSTLLINLLVASVSVIYLGTTLAATFSDAVPIWQQAKERTSLIEQTKARGAKSVVLPLFFLDGAGYDNKTDHPGRTLLEDFTNSSDDWRHQCFVRAHRLEDAQVVPAPVGFTDNFLKRALNSGPTDQSKGILVYVDKDKIFYVAKGTSCESYPERSPIFLHVYPIKEKSLHPRVRKVGFEKLDFAFDKPAEVFSLDSNGKVDKNVCVLYARLPKYPISEIKTGQLDPASSRPYWEQSIELRPGQN
jgi:hypothetical protein